MKFLGLLEEEEETFSDERNFFTFLQTITKHLDFWNICLLISTRSKFDKLVTKSQILRSRFKGENSILKNELKRERKLLMFLTTVYRETFGFHESLSFKPDQVR